MGWNSKLVFWTKGIKMQFTLLLRGGQKKWEGTLEIEAFYVNIMRTKIWLEWGLVKQALKQKSNLVTGTTLYSGQSLADSWSKSQSTCALGMCVLGKKDFRKWPQISSSLCKEQAVSNKKEAENNSVYKPYHSFQAWGHDSDILMPPASEFAPPKGQSFAS